MAAIPTIRETPASWRIAADAVTVGSWTTAAKLAGALKLIVIARCFGASAQLDAFLIAFVIPSFIADIMTGAYTAAVVPALIRARTRDSDTAAHRVCREALGIGVLLTFAAALVMAALGSYLVPLFGSSLAAADKNLAILLFRALLIWVPLSGCIATWRGALNASGHFALPAAAQAATPLATIAALYCTWSAPDVYTLCIGTLIGVAVECGVLGYAVRQQGFPLTFSWPSKLTSESDVFRRFLPLAAGASISSACLLVDQAVAGTLGPGSVSALSYGVRFIGVLLVIGGTALSTAALPALSRLAADCNWSGMRHTVRTYSAAIVAISIPATLILAYLSEPIVRLMLQRGAFTPEVTRQVAQIQMLAILQLPFALPLAFFVRLACAVSADSLITRVAIVNLVANIALDLLFANLLGVAGIALATSVVQALSLGFLLYFLREKTHGALSW